MKQCMALVCLLTCACAHKELMRKSVDMRMVLPPSADRTELRDDQTFFMAVPIDNRLPLYPEAVVEGQLERTVCVEIVVAESGDVTSARAIDLGDHCFQSLPESEDPFVSAALQAVRGWSFFAAGVCTHAPGNSSECDQPDAVIKPLAIKLSYEFVFSKTRGVSASVLGSSRQ